MEYINRLLVLACQERAIEKKMIEKKIEFNQNLTDELKRMEKIDQIAAYILKMNTPRCQKRVEFI